MKKSFLILFFCGVLIMNLFGKGTKGVLNNNSPATGGHVTNSYDAPVTIESHKIVSFNTHFVVFNKKTMDMEWYEFQVMPLEDGTVILSETRSFCAEAPIGEEDLLGLDEIIRKHELLEKNGYDSHTAGLPPEYQPCALTALYDSGEKLYFSENNNPYAEWSMDLVVFFRELFIQKGHSELIPVSSPIKKFTIRYNRGPIERTFGTIWVADDYGNEREMLYLEDYDMENPCNNDTEPYFYEKTPEIMEALRKLVEETGMEEFERKRPSDNVTFSGTFYDIAIDYEDYTQLYTDTNYTSLREEFEPCAQALDAFIAALKPVEL